MIDKNDHIGRKRLHDEFSNLSKEPLFSLGCTVGLNNDNIYQWRATMCGPKDSLYKEGLFYIELAFPENYPESPPKIRFLTPIYHLNVFSGADNNLGRICPNFITSWKPSTNAKEILTKLYTIFYKNELENAFDLDKKEEYKKHYDLFRAKALFFTKKYASPFSKIKIDKTKGWDFFCCDCIFNPLDLRPEEEKIISYNRYDNNNNKYINVIVLINGTIKIDVKCLLKDTTRDIIKRLSFKYHLSFDAEVLYLYSCEKLNLDIPIGYYHFDNNKVITIIFTSDIKFLKDFSH